MAQGAVDFLLFLHEASHGKRIGAASSFGNLAAEVALTVLKLTAT